jgi:hypothetical protein
MLDDTGRSPAEQDLSIHNRVINNQQPSKEKWDILLFQKDIPTKEPFREAGIWSIWFFWAV